MVSRLQPAIKMVGLHYISSAERSALIQTPWPVLRRKN